MAPNSSVFNEAPTEAKPPSAPETAMPPATDSRPVTAVSAASTSTATTTSTECSTSSASKQAAPKMEATVVEDQDAETARFDSAAPFRFNRVMPVGLDDAKKTMTFRKSCLKRSSSFLPSSFQEMPVKPIEPEAIPEPEQPKEPEAPVQKNRRRCWECKAKVGLTALTCRCDYTFCSKHRYAEEHNCRFNFKSAAKRKLEDENPRIVPAKVARIN